ncbi:phage holin family protein [Streptomyces sp. NPDC058534]|uniref:phage holin family protein n=1 Tax=Streptomyces sp. NPDC058534 TaxID=3346541 RepID=UPI0036563946
MNKPPEEPNPTATEDSVGELVKHASEQLSQLVRQELALGQAEMKEKAKRFGFGGGLFGGAGLVGFLALQALVVTAIAALDLVWPLWAAALAVTALLFAVAGTLAVTGKKQIGHATPASPQQTIESVKTDVAAIKESAHR